MIAHSSPKVKVEAIGGISNKNPLAKTKNYAIMITDNRAVGAVVKKAPSVAAKSQVC